MDWQFIRRLVSFIYVAIILTFVGIGFCYSNETNDELRENMVYFDNFWNIDGKIITFPYSNHEEFTMSNTLPTVYGDQLLILRAYYQDYEVYINNDLILESRSNRLFGVSTDVGKKEIWIPLQSEYTGQKISIKLNLQESIYGSEMTECIISTRSAYAITQLKKNIPSAILFVVFTVTGILEVIISLFFILKRTHLIRKLSFEALFYAGVFSIVSAQWIIQETRVPFIVFGYTTGFSILTVIAFLLMPLMFFEIARALFMRIGPIDNLIDGIMALTIIISCFMCITGVIDWGSIVYIAHLLDVVVMIMVGIYSYKSLKDEQKLTSKTAIAFANIFFILIAGLALVQYVNNVNTSYILLIIIDLLIYVMVQVGLIYRRIGLNVQEEKEFARAKIYAFTDELTGLGNRRHFYNVMEDFEKHKLPNDLTIIAIDVNRLKFYNDNYGHDAGDELLIGTSQCLQKAFSSNSTSTISRMGGDEFSVLLLASENDLNKRLNHFNSALQKWKGKYVDGISVSIGHACVRNDGDMPLEELSKIADNRMYEDKAKYYKESGLDRRK
ncbi:MAG: GGDEF domain-containing protein [Butyrivibrio sp.]|jgi:diguanylate cyclase (GGDEF)-like protein|nr:GGDEF domain-containing protein [Butyrivibrio sp.]